VKSGETARTLAARKLAEMTPEEKDSFIFNSLFKKEERRIREAQERRDQREAEAELAGNRLPMDMPTILDAEVRTTGDDGTIDYKTRDDASPKEHLSHLEHKAAVYGAMSGIQDRKRERLSDWTAEQGSALDHEAPIGPYIWDGVRCSICGHGIEKTPQLGPFVRAHDIAVATGVSDGTTEWAHKLCNEMEGVG
jgi:hypothetical protein